MENSSEKTNKEILWRQYSQHTDLYKFYLSLVLKANIFYYAITGAILSYYFTNIEKGPIKYSLLLPIILSISLGMIFLRGALLMKYPRREMFRIRDELGLDSAPEFNILTLFLYVFGIILFLVGTFLLLFFFCPKVFF